MLVYFFRTGTYNYSKVPIIYFQSAEVGGGKRSICADFNTSGTYSADTFMRLCSSDDMNKIQYLHLSQNYRFSVSIITKLQILALLKLAVLG
mgnify:CR=1 FL=1